MMGNSSSLGHSNSKTILIIVISAVVVLLAAAAGYFFWQYTQLKNNPNAESEATTKRLVDKVSKLYDVPADESPTVALVQDKEKLKDQEFFNKAQNGDYILIYTNIKTAILYRENENKLINVGPITISDSDKDESGE